MQQRQQYQQPEAIYLDNYDNFEQVAKQLPPLTHINSPLEPDATYFLVRAPTKDNIHRAIKYGVWTSSSRNNQKLNDAMRPVYLLFNITQASCFIGLAKVTSHFQEKSHFKYWAEENKWFGTFSIEWIFLKDLPYIELSTIKQSTGKGIHELIDCTMIENGDQIFPQFEKAEQKSCVLKQFKELDVSEQKKRKDRDNNPIFEQQFKEYITVFEQMPFSFSVASYQRRKLQQTQYEYYNHYQYLFQSPYVVAQPQFWNNQQSTPQSAGFYQHPNKGYKQQQQQEQPQQTQEQFQQQFPAKQKKPLRKPQGQQLE